MESESVWWKTMERTNERTSFSELSHFSQIIITHTHIKQLYWRYVRCVWSVCVFCFVFSLLCKYESKRNNHSRCFIFFWHHQMLLYFVLLSLPLFYFNWCNNVTVHRLSLVIHGIRVLFFIRNSAHWTNERETNLRFGIFLMEIQQKNWVTERCVYNIHIFASSSIWKNGWICIFHSNICTHQQHIFRSIWFSAYDSPLICIRTCCYTG